MENSTQTPKSWFQAHAQKLIALLFRVLLIVGYQWYANINHLSPLQVVQQLLDFMTNGFWGPIVYIVLYAIRPLILFPSTVLTLAGGFVFGPVLGEYVEYQVAVNKMTVRAQMSMPAQMFSHGEQVHVRFPEEHLFEVKS